MVANHTDSGAVLLSRSAVRTLGGFDVELCGERLRFGSRAPYATPAELNVLIALGGVNGPVGQLSVVTSEYLRKRTLIVAMVHRRPYDYSLVVPYPFANSAVSARASGTLPASLL